MLSASNPSDLHVYNSVIYIITLAITVPAAGVSVITKLGVINMHAIGSRYITDFHKSAASH